MGFQPAGSKKRSCRLFRNLRAISGLLMRLSVGRFNLVIIFRLQPDLPSERQIQMLGYIMIPANAVDKFKGLKITNNNLTKVDLPANVRQQNNNS